MVSPENGSSHDWRARLRSLRRKSSQKLCRLWKGVKAHVKKNIAMVYAAHIAVGRTIWIGIVTVGERIWKEAKADPKTTVGIVLTVIIAIASIISIWPSGKPPKVPTFPTHFGWVAIGRKDWPASDRTCSKADGTRVEPRDSECSARYEGEVAVCWPDRLIGWPPGGGDCAGWGAWCTYKFKGPSGEGGAQSTAAAYQCERVAASVEAPGELIGAAIPPARQVTPPATVPTPVDACPIGDPVYPDMVRVSGGSFLMGANSADTKSRAIEKPQHPVTVKSFFMSKAPITFTQWDSASRNMAVVTTPLLITAAAVGVRQMRAGAAFACP